MEEKFISILSELTWDDEIIEEKMNLKDVLEREDIVEQLLTDDLPMRKYTQLQENIEDIVNDESWLSDCNIVEAVAGEIRAVALEDEYDNAYIAYCGNCEGDTYLEFTEAVEFLNNIGSRDEYDTLIIVGRGLGSELAKFAPFMCSADIKEKIISTFCYEEIGFADVNLYDLITTVKQQLGNCAKNTARRQLSSEDVAGLKFDDKTADEITVTDVINSYNKQSVEIKKRMDELVKIKNTHKHLTRDEVNNIDKQLKLLSEQYIHDLNKEKELLKKKYDHYKSIKNVDATTRKSILNYCDGTMQRLREIKKLLEECNKEYDKHQYDKKKEENIIAKKKTSKLVERLMRILRKDSRLKK